MDHDPPLSLPPGARTLLLAPDTVTRMVAAADTDPERRWILRLPRAVRRSFVLQVVDAGGTRAAQERWMLLQDDAIRDSFVEEVLRGGAEPADPRTVWLLRQDRRVRESYVADVLGGGGPG